MQILKILKTPLNSLVWLMGRIIGSPFAETALLVRPARVIDHTQTPSNLSALPAHMQSWFTDATSLPAQIVYRLRRVKIAWNGLVVNQLRVFVPSLVVASFEKEFSGTFLLRQLFTRTTKLSYTVALIYDNWSYENYYHWLVDSLPRLLLLREVDVTCALLIPASAPNYVVDSIIALNLGVIQLINEKEFVAPQQLLVPARVASPGRQNPELIQQLRARLRIVPFLGNATTSPRWIYVSRSKQRFRRLVNEAEVIRMLVSYKVEMVYFEDVNFEQQIRLMQNVAVFIGAHGANLANMLFLNEGATVIEMLNNHVPNPCYFYMASNLNLKYYAVPCEGVSAGYDDIFNSQNLYVDVEFLDSILRSLALIT